MKRTRWLMAVGILAALVQNARATVYVTQVGTADGSGPALTSASTALFLQKYADTGGAPTASIPFPIVQAGDNRPFTIAGTASSEGFLTRSQNGLYMTVAGYSVAPGTASIAGTTSAVAPRGVARIDLADDSIATGTFFPDTTYSGGNPRSAVSSDGTSLWLTGSNQGVRAGQNGNTIGTTLISNTLTNTRVANIFDGQLYISSAAGGTFGVSAVGTGLPIDTGTATTVKVSTAGSGTGNASSYDFWFKDASTLYVADDRSAANGGGIQKWLFDSEPMTWSLAYTLSVGTGTGGGSRALSGAVNGSGDAVLYATTTEASANRLVTITDTGAASAFTLVATAPTNTAFRGVEYIPGAAPPENNADFNSDNVVDGTDFLIWQAGYGLADQTGKTNGNANADTVVDDLDFAAWVAKFGGPPAAAVAAGVPEPGALVLAALGLAGVWRVRRGRPM